MATALSPTNVPRSAQDKHLSALFRRQVAPALGDLERQRQRYRQRFFLVLSAMPIGIFAAFLLLQELHYALFAAVIAFAVGCLLLQHTQRSYTNLVRTAVMPAVCEAIGDIAHTTGSAPDLEFHGLQQIGLLPGHNRRRIDDVFHGHHRDTAFTMAEVRLRREGHGSKRKNRTVFRGLIFAIGVPQAVSGRILIAKDGGVIGNRLKSWVKGFSGMQPVPLPHEAFEARFELYADQPALARETVTPALCDNLVALAEAHNGAPIQAAFAHDRFFVAMPKRGNQFRIGSLFRSTELLDQEAGRLLHDVQIVHRLIDYLHGDRPPLDPGAVKAPVAVSKPASSGPGPVERC